MAVKQEFQLLRSDGTLNIKSKGVSKWEQFDLHTSLVTIGWPSFFLVLFLMFLAINVLFTSIYILLNPDQLTGVSRNDFWGRVIELFFFSNQILTTLGSSRISPVGLAANSVAAAESVFSVIFFAFATGLSYARFERPRPMLIYSETMVIGKYEGYRALMVRAVNHKRIQLVDLTAEMSFTVGVRINGKLTRLFYPLSLVQPTLGMMMMSWVIVHKITEDSPLDGLTAEDLINADAEILVMIKGADDVLSKSVFSRTSFKTPQIIWGAEFLSITETDEAGNMRIDVGRMHEIRKVPDFES